MAKANLPEGLISGEEVSHDEWMKCFLLKNIGSRFLIFAPIRWEVIRLLLLKNVSTEKRLKGNLKICFFDARKSVYITLSQKLDRGICQCRNVFLVEREKIFQSLLHLSSHRHFAYINFPLTSLRLCFNFPPRTNGPMVKAGEVKATPIACSIRRRLDGEFSRVAIRFFADGESTLGRRLVTLRLTLSSSPRLVSSSL